MVFRQRLGLSVPPVLLRIAVAATFLWAGAGKFWAPTTLTPEQEATLQGIESGGPTGAPAQPESQDAAPANQNDEPVALGAGAVLMLAQDGGAADDATSSTPDADAAPNRTGKDRLALLVHGRAQLNAEGKALLPEFMGRGKWPIWIAFAVGLTELVGGILVLLGLLTRFAAFLLAGVMIGAIWMTSIGPVVIYGEAGWPAFLQILPALDYSSPDAAGRTFQAWQSFSLQLVTLMAALSLVCLGAGPLSVDRFAFGKPGAPRRLDDDGDGAADGDGDD